MNFDEILQQQNIEEQQRFDSSNKIEVFLTRTIGKENLKKPDFLVNLLSRINYSEFISYITKINGIIKGISPKDRNIFQHDSNIITSFITSESAEIVPPNKETREVIMREVFNKLKKIAQSEDKKKSEIISQLLFNSIIYLHPFPDGNGRTARTIYQLFSKNYIDSNIKLSEAIKDRSNELVKYHEEINFYSYYLMLLERNIKWQDRGKDEQSVWPNFVANNPGIGFDKTYLTFIACYDAMSKEDRNKYIIKGEHNELSIIEEKIPEELKVKIKQMKEKIREEMVRKVLDLSSTIEWPADQLLVMLKESMISNHKD